MSAFEFVFSLFGLLLGLSLVEVLGGMARTVEARLRPAGEGGRAFRIGWLTPLLGVFVLLDLLSFWGSAWVAREALVVSGPVLTGGLLFASAYYLAAHLVFPKAPEEVPDMDAHYFRVRRIVFGMLLLLLTVQLAFFASVPALAPLLRRPDLLFQTALLVVMIVAAMVVRSERASAVLLVALSLRYIITAIF